MKNDSCELRVVFSVYYGIWGVISCSLGENKDPNDSYLAKRKVEHSTSLYYWVASENQL